ncbi:MAG TPA: 16S rRNA (cytosine(1402)-N(4))-methyltransferase, partial [Methylomirabilota bacterium]|nr:16S rRNA (cytosine(1402)-N(4))-methyltransferase [Methylomirabilota bacterium]
MDEVAFLLRPRDGGWVIDGTVGMGGHAEALLQASGREVRLLGLDADPGALRQAGERLARFGARARLVHASFADLERVAGE